MIHRLLIVSLAIVCISPILSTENNELDIQKLVKESIEYAESQVANVMQDMFQKKSVTVDSSPEGKIYHQYLQEQFGPYWKSVEQFCKDAANMNNLPQMNIWTKIKQLEEQIVQLQQEVDSLKKGLPANS